MNVVTDNLDIFWRGFQTTVELSALSYVIALMIGLIVASFRVSPIPPLRWVGATYVELYRNIPLTVLFIFMFFGITKVGIKFDGFTTAVIALSLYTGAFLAETIRSGINSVAAGQAEAARSIGLSFSQTLGSIVLPQALRTVVGPLGGLLLALTKNSAIASVIAVNDLTFRTESLANETAQVVQVFAGAVVLYILLSWTLAFCINRLERKVAIKR